MTPSEAPHDEDWAVIRAELGAGEERRAGDAGLAAGAYVQFIASATENKLIEIGVVRWNLLGPDGQEMPVTAESAALLDDATRTTILNRLNALTAPPGDDDEGPGPNASGAPSAAGTPVKRSRTRSTRARKRT